MGFVDEHILPQITIESIVNLISKGQLNKNKLDIMLDKYFIVKLNTTTLLNQKTQASKHEKRIYFINNTLKRKNFHCFGLINCFKHFHLIFLPRIQN